MGNILIYINKKGVIKPLFFMLFFINIYFYWCHTYIWCMKNNEITGEQKNNPGKIKMLVTTIDGAGV
jgi:hypothetical protein